MQRRPQEWLQPDEEVLHDTGRHPLSVLDAILGTTLLLGLLVAGAWVFVRFFPAFSGYALVVTIVLVAVWLCVLVAAYWRVRTSRYVVSTDRIYRSHGRLRWVLLQTTYDKVTDLHVRQSLFGRIWGFGDVTAQTAGTGLTMGGVRDPFGVKRQIEAARRAFIEGLLREYGLERQAERAAAPTETGTDAATDEDGAEAWRPVEKTPEVLWRGGPVAYTLLPAFGSAAVIALVGIFVTFGALGSDQPGLLVLFGPAMMLFALLSFVQAFIQFRYTRYEVAPWGVVVTSGWLSRRRVETTFEKVTDVATYQNFFARLLDYGNIKINTAGSNEAPVNFNGLARPEEVKRLIDEARRRLAERRRR